MSERPSYLADDGGSIRIVRGSDYYALHTRVWEPSQPRGWFVCLHGIQSHSGWYGWSAKKLSETGWAVWLPDRRGSGLNSPPRGHVEHPRRLISDTIAVIRAARAERDRISPSAPVVLGGLSWGGKLAGTIAGERASLIDALVLMYPGIRARVKPNWYQRRLLGLGMRSGKARKLVDIPLQDASLFTANASARRFIENDPLALHQATVGFLWSSMKLDEAVESAALQITCPVLLLLAGRDRIADNAQVRSWLDQTSARQRAVIEYDDAEHTLEFETPVREQFAADLNNWLAAR